jgi:hypothetical protein
MLFIVESKQTGTAPSLGASSLAIIPLSWPCALGGLRGGGLPPEKSFHADFQYPRIVGLTGAGCMRRGAVERIAWGTAGE